MLLLGDGEKKETHSHMEMILPTVPGKVYTASRYREPPGPLRPQSQFVAILPSIFQRTRLTFHARDDKGSIFTKEQSSIPETHNHFVGRENLYPHMPKARGN